ncbi:fimbrial protein [Aeromonas sp. sif2433]|uniref:fimbrial protein n=1 Tax=Aeromonas sp. sif2433 TaxID=2854794 RepID=UPI001C48773C|nr:fimbrial protein [Aeromonas sp. sif2433]MBV7414937.1 type 1 fimbrial protein [Aeromonas sp. sif2433]
MNAVLYFSADRNILIDIDGKYAFTRVIRVAITGSLWCSLVLSVFHSSDIVAKTYLGPPSSQINISVPEGNNEPYLVANAGLTASNVCHPSAPTVKDREGSFFSYTAATAHTVVFNGKVHTLMSTGNPYFGVIVPTRDTSAPDSDAVPLAWAPTTWYPTPNSTREPGTDAIDARFRYVLYAMPGELPAGSHMIPQMEAFLGVDCRDSEGKTYQDRVGQRAFTVNVTARGCDVTSPANTYIDFGELSTSDFSAVGSTTSTISSMINLQCDPNVEINVTLSDQTDPSNRTDIVGLTAASTARGLGVQVVNPGAGKSYWLGPDDASNHGINQVLLGLSGANGGAFNFPLGFRFVRTGEMTAGTATALVGVTMSYQ